MAVKLDPVTLEVIRNALPAIANEMSADLQRTSYNMMIYEVRDYCCAILDVKGRLISQNLGGVSHFVADLGVIIEDGVKQYGIDGFKPGDVLITNHQAVAGQHLNNIVIYTPHFHKGELVFFAITRAHWVDVGGMSTGFGATNVADPWLEGLQLDQLKIYDGGVEQKPLLKVIRDNIRFPDAAFGDMRGQIASCKLASRRLEELLEKYGKNVVLASIERIFDETEFKCRRVVETIPDGEYEANALWDEDGVDHDDPVKLHAKVTVSGGRMTIDLSGCSQQRKGSLNSRTYAGARVAYKALTAPLEPVNEGSFRALDVIIPEGNIMMAKFPAVMAGWSLIVPTVVDTILHALANAIPDRIPAAHHGVLGGSIVVVGQHPKTGRSFMVQSIEGGGWGGRPTEDGESGSVSICQGDVRNATIEGTEIKNPVLFEGRALRADSGGAGKNRGGLGLDVTIRNLVDAKWNLIRPRRNLCPPWGLNGGKQGSNGDYLVREPGDNDFHTTEAFMHPVPKDTRVIVRTGGGGGWGDPYQRDPEKVRWDVVEGLVSVDVARRDYGVVLDPKTYAIDAAATAKLRSAPRTQAAE
ncbi:MAG TPA: hydantoinase B/oxoprolinase family protein [Alphaproteobacteria bacterium]